RGDQWPPHRSRCYGYLPSGCRWWSWSTRCWCGPCYCPPSCTSWAASAGGRPRHSPGGTSASVSAMWRGSLSCPPYLRLPPDSSEQVIPGTKVSRLYRFDESPGRGAVWTLWSNNEAALRWALVDPANSSSDLLMPHAV